MVTMVLLCPCGPSPGPDNGGLGGLDAFSTPPGPLSSPPPSLLQTPKVQACIAMSCLLSTQTCMFLTDAVCNIHDSIHLLLWHCTEQDLI